MIARSLTMLFALLAAAHADTLLLKDGTSVKGRWWSLDANELHFLVDNQLQHYPRAAVSAVTFGDATLPPLPTATAAPPPAQAPATQPPPAQAPPAQAPPSLSRPAPSLTRQPPTLARQEPTAPAAPKPAAPAAQSTPSEPEQPGLIYFQNPAGGLTPLEKNQAVERRRGNTQYWEIPTARSPVRVKSAPELVFVVRLPEGADLKTYSLYPLVTANNTRRTEPQPGRLPGPVTLPFEIKQLKGSTYAFSVADLATGEYSFSPSSSNDGYCFGVDAAPGR